ncbi:MAG TPA: alpha/beta hydrolase [Actinomycetes bacterium]|nr:alpha/beta hydrolase [Actinomycetes bacterium]
MLRALFEVDVRPLLPLIQAPTLVLHRCDFPLLPIEHGRYLAEHIPNARLVELPGADGPLTWAGAPQSPRRPGGPPGRAVGRPGGEVDW